MKLISIFLILLVASCTNPVFATTLDFYKNGISETVSVDTAVPANTLAYPMGYFNTSGVQTNVATEATLLLLEGKDFATETTLLLLEGKDFATQTTLLLLEGKDFATEATLQNAETRLIAIDTSTAAISVQALAQTAIQGQIETNTAGVFNATGFAASAAPARMVQMGGRDGSGDLRPLAVSTAGILQVDVASTALPTGAATEATLSALNTKVNSNFGSDSSAVRVAAQLGSSAGPANFGAGNAGSNTLRTVIATDQSPLPVASSALNVTGTGAALNATPIAPTDVTSFKTGYVQITGTFVATATLEGSNDASTWVTVVGQTVSSPTVAPITTINAVGIYYVPIFFKNFRLRISAYTSGTMSANMHFTGVASNQLTQDSSAVTQSGVWTVQPGNTVNTTPWLVNVRMPAVTVKQAAITVGTSAVRLTTDAAVPSATRQRLNFMLDPASTANCYMGASSVTTSSTTRGLIIFPGATQEYVNDANDYYLICDAAAQTVFVTEAE
jgi:hypothetical protein